MKLLKGIIIFGVAFITAWILIFTFIQEPFKQTAAARILTWWTPPIPIYLYVAGAFGIGFGAGLAVALVNYLSLQARLHHQIKEHKDLEIRFAAVEGRLKQCEAQHEPEERREVQLFEAVGEKMEEEPGDAEEVSEEKPVDDGDASV